ncbi:MAG: DUF72 domain-containing protein [Desulfobacteraceae bacterium]|nr:DUF72 domain-containing protein [Desulfobacteraceae bacterium]
MELLIGTSGYSYRAWRRGFYPKGLAPRDMLQFYGEHLPAVEINATFYGLPRPGGLAAWAGQVGPGFRFALKAPRTITHLAPLLGKEKAVASFFERAAFLGDRLGAVLIQLPPSFPKNRPLLEGFAELLPGSLPIAFEFRHPSWLDDGIYEILHRHGWALCWTDGDREELGRFVPTADWGYLRLRRRSYPEAALRGWARTILSQEWRAVFAFFKHEESGAGPAFAKRLLELCRAAQ